MSDYLSVERIEFAVTYRCNSRCGHCQVDPGRRRMRPTAIDPELAAAAVRALAQAYTPRSVMTFGGEPLLARKAVLAIHAAARDCGIPRRQVITNAGWPRDPQAFQALAEELAAAGVNEVLVSVDAFHQACIPLAEVERNVRALQLAGIPRLALSPCWVVDRTHDNPYNRRTRAILDGLAHLGVEEGKGNVAQPEGQARDTLAGLLSPRRPVAAEARCGDLPYTAPLDQVRSIAVEPDGRVAVCDAFYIGSVGEGDLLELLRGYDPYRIPAARAILEGGMAGLAALARHHHIEPDPAGYYSICDMCKSLRRALAASMDSTRML